MAKLQLPYKVTQVAYYPDLEKLDKLSKTERAAAEHATDFEVPIYDVWKQQAKSNTVSHFGNASVAASQDPSVL